MSDRFPIVFGIAGAVIAAAFVLTATVPDDAYIYFRYADHLAEGDGWRYNLIGNSGNAATSPLYTVLLAAIHRIGVPLPAASQAISTVAMWATMIFGRLTFQRLGRPLAAWPFAAILATAPLGLSVGMETLLYAALVMGALYLFLERRDVPLGVIVVMVAATRAEGALLAVVVFLLAWRDDRRLPSRLMWTAVAAVAIWGALQWLVVGQVLPTPLEGKIAQVTSGLWRPHVAGLLFHAANRPLWVGTLAAAAIGGMGMLRGRSRIVALALLSLAAGTAIAHELIGVAFYGWYAAMTVLAAAFAASWFAATSKVHLAIVVATLASTGIMYPTVGETQPIVAYRAAGKWIAASSPSEASVASTEIGAVGWWSRRCIIDYLGLLDEEAAAHLASRDFAWWIGHYQPDYWVTTDRGGWIEDPALTAAGEDYRPVFRSGRVTVLERVVPVDGRAGLCAETVDLQFDDAGT